jgi:hypothetical protein
MKEVTFILKHPIKYHQAGSVEEGYELIMHAPSIAVYRQVSALKQGFFDQVNKLKNNVTTQSADANAMQEEMQGEALVSMLYMAGNLDVNKYLGHFKEICLEGLVLLPNGVKINQQQLDSLSPDDFERLAGEYILNFILGSLFSKTLAK